jgi:hypothetical protein
MCESLKCRDALQCLTLLCNNKNHQKVIKTLQNIFIDKEKRILEPFAQYFTTGDLIAMCDNSFVHGHYLSFNFLLNCCGGAFYTFIICHYTKHLPILRRMIEAQSNLNNIKTYADLFIFTWCKVEDIVTIFRDYNSHMTFRVKKFFLLALQKLGVDICSLDITDFLDDVKDKQVKEWLHIQKGHSLVNRCLLRLSTTLSKKKLTKGQIHALTSQQLYDKFKLL